MSYEFPVILVNDWNESYEAAALNAFQFCEYVQKFTNIFDCTHT